MTDQKYHPLSFVAFLLAVFLLVLPGEADCVWAALPGELGLALLTFGVMLAVVAIPLLYAQWQTGRRPEKYKPRLLSKITWAIIGLSAAANAFWFANYLWRTQPHG